MLEIDDVVKEMQKLYGGKDAIDVYARTLERHALFLRCYRADAGLSLLLGRLCTMMECAPTAAAEFAKEVAEARKDCCIGFLKQTNKTKANEFDTN